MLNPPKVDLPNNMNGYRTTHTCELCGFEPKTKNKYREKQDHMVMKHFKEKIDKIFPTTKPYKCPTESCVFLGKDKQALLRHYTGKHGVLERYLKEALAEKGIHYEPGETTKRRNPTGSSELEKSSKMIKIVNSTNTTSNEALRREVEAMMASFQPQPLQANQIVVLPQNTQLFPLPFQCSEFGSLKINDTIKVSLPQQPVSVGLPSMSQSSITNSMNGLLHRPPFSSSSFVMSPSGLILSQSLSCTPNLIIPPLPTEPLPLQVVSGHSCGIVTTTSQSQSTPLTSTKAFLPTNSSNGNYFDFSNTPGETFSYNSIRNRSTKLPSLIPLTPKSSIEENEVVDFNIPSVLSNFPNQNSTHEVIIDPIKVEDNNIIWNNDSDVNVNLDCSNFPISYNENCVETLNDAVYDALMVNGAEDVQERQLDFYMM